MQKKMFYWAQAPRGCDVACKATWQRHADPAQRLRGVLYIYIYMLFTIVIKGVFSLPYMGRVINPLNGRVL